MSESTGKSSVSSLKNICQARLDELVRSVEGLQMAVIASDNGFPLASINLDSREGRRVTTLGSNLTDSARKVCSELNLVGLHSATLETDTGMALCRLVDNQVLPMLLMVIGLLLLAWIGWRAYRARERATGRAGAVALEPAVVKP